LAAFGVGVNGATWNTGGAGVSSLELVIVGWLLLQNAIDVALAVQDANDPHRVLHHHI
jgi:hypothetical protein